MDPWFSEARPSEPLDWDTRVLGAHLKLGDLNPKPVCHGYANACVCVECLDREQNTDRPKPTVVFPWEGEAA